jgi:capsular exopolysaccharide synthesis family protein
MSIWKNISERLHLKRVEKVSQKTSRSSHRTEYLLSDDTPFDVTEGFRNLKSSLSVSVPKKEGGTVIMMTSAYPEDGKTTVTTNLALMFALSYSKVLLIDADIRKGRIAKYFNKRTSPGLSDYLSGQKTLEEVVYHSKKHEHLSYITCGTHSPKPYELLESDEMKNLLDELRKEYDYIIIDTPPVLLISDALALAPFTDGVALVCRHQVSYVSDISRALNTLSFAKANVLGIIVNDYKAQKTGKFYGGYKKYYYYNSYAYGSTNPNDTDEENANAPIPTPAKPLTENAAVESVATAEAPAASEPTPPQETNN